RRTEATPLTRMEGDARASAPEPAAPDEPKLALIDFGMTARLSDTLREQVIQLLLDMAENRGSAVAGTLLDIGNAGPRFERASFEREIATLLARNYDRAIGEVQAGRLLFEMFGIAYE